MRLSCHGISQKDRYGAVPQRGRSPLLVLVDVIDDILNRLDLLSSLIGDLDVKLFLKSHDELNDIEGISTKIVNERRLQGDLISLRAKLLNDNVANLVKRCVLTSFK